MQPHLSTLSFFFFLFSFPALRLAAAFSGSSSCASTLRSRTKPGTTSRVPISLAARKRLPDQWRTLREEAALAFYFFSRFFHLGTVLFFNISLGSFLQHFFHLGTVSLKFFLSFISFFLVIFQIFCPSVDIQPVAQCD